MAPDTITNLLKLPTEERREIAVALWESLGKDQVDDLGLTSDEAEELDQRYQRFLKNPSSGTSWDEVRRKAEELL